MEGKVNAKSARMQTFLMARRRSNSRSSAAAMKLQRMGPIERVTGDKFVWPLGYLHVAAVQRLPLSGVPRPA
ncbi:MAG TPA: hypothetical protein VKB50_29965, partial [Vicinamibacterales bacterium]|nr:hypothetical protein [Vicinamibacterales bacterium]